MKRRHGDCARCGKYRQLLARRLCSPCYQTAYAYGILEHYPLARPPRPAGSKPERKPFTRAQGECARCERPRELVARHLCRSCWVAAKRDGTLIDYDRQRRTHADLIEEYEFLRGQGETSEQIARRLGYAHADSLRGALWYARKTVAA